MDPNQNLVPGVDPNALGASPAPTPTPAPGPVLAPDPALAAPLAPEPAAAPTLGDNPAATVADAALAGATPVVTTTDLNATDVAPAPTLQAPAEDTGPVSLAPSADFQMGEVSTVSAVQNGADGNLAASTDNEVMIGQPLEPENPMDNVGANTDGSGDGASDSGESENNGQGPADFNDPDAVAAAEAAAEKKAKEKEEEEDEPIVAAAPVPGSIGSAKSYADIQRAEAEKAAKVAAKGGKGGLKLSKNVIIYIVIGVIAVIGIIVGVLVLTSGNSKPTQTKTSTPAYSDDDEEDQNISTLSCKRNLAPEEYASYGAVSGTQENIFYFKDGEETLNGLATNFAYTYANQSLTNFWRDKLAADYGVVPNSEEDDENGETEEPDTEEDDNTSNKKKTTAEMLHHYVTTKNFTVTHGMEIKSEDIEDWLESDAYSDVTYGASENGATAPAKDGEETSEETTETTETEIIRNLDYYNRLQNSIDYTCSKSIGY